MQTIAQIFKSTVEIHPNKVFIKYKEQEMTYEEMDIKTNQLANVFRKFNIKKGDVVGLYLPSCIELAIGYYACQKIGAIALPLSDMYRYKEINNVIKKTDMQFIITTEDNYPIAETIRNTGASLEHIMVIRNAIENSISFEKEISKADKNLEEVTCSITDTAVIFFTSGTTGSPKGAMQTHKSIYSAVQAMNNFWKFKYGEEKLLCTLPIFNNFGATVMMNGALFNGSTLVLHERWNTQEVLRAITDERITFFAGAPTMFSYLLEDYDPDVHDVSPLKLCVSGGASMAAELNKRIEKTLQVDTITIYGATETSGAITAQPVYGSKKENSVGVPMGSTRIKIVDENDNECSPGEIGEIVIESDAVGNGYWKDDKETDAAFKQKGWYSGDIGYMDEEGFLYIVDRKKDIIIMNGFNVFPVEIEEVLYSLPEVSLASVVGVRDEVRGEIPKAFIKLKQGETLTEEEIINYCREHLAPYKIPRVIEFVEDFPLGPTGKILKRELQKQ